VFTFIAESCSGSSRNAVRHHPGIAFILSRIPQQEGFADIVGVHRTWMGAVERGESNVSFTNLVLISRALGVSMSLLLSGLEKRAEKLRVPAKHLSKR